MNTLSGLRDKALFATTIADESNRASAAATEDHYDKLHAMDYLAYAYLQGAQDLAAKRIFDDMNALGKVNSEH